MPTETYTAIENLLYQYVCAIYTSKQVQRKLAKIGYKADLKGNSHIIDVMDIETGNYYQVEIYI